MLVLVDVDHCKLIVVYCNKYILTQIRVSYVYLPILFQVTVCLSCYI